MWTVKALLLYKNNIFLIYQTTLSNLLLVIPGGQYSINQHSLLAQVITKVFTSLILIVIINISIISALSVLIHIIDVGAFNRCVTLFLAFRSI